MKPRYQEALSDLLMVEIQREAKLSERQVLLLEWNQIEGDKLVTKLGREVQLCPATLNALYLVRSGKKQRFIFSRAPLSRLSDYDLGKVRKTHFSLAKLLLN